MKKETVTLSMPTLFVALMRKLSRWIFFIIFLALCCLLSWFTVDKIITAPLFYYMAGAVALKLLQANDKRLSRSA